MSLDMKRRRLLAVSLAAAAVGGGVTAAAPYATAASAARPGCTTIDLVETTVRFYVNEPVSDMIHPPVGMMTAYLDPLTDPAGTKIGDSTGHMDILPYAANGHVIASISETLDLPDGALISDGVYDRTAIVSGAWVSAPIKGLSGAYAGRYGVWKWRLTSVKPPLPVEEKIVLCGHGHGHGHDDIVDSDATGSDS